MVKIPAKLSFLLAITDSRLPGYDSDNAGFDAFSKEGAQRPISRLLTGKLTLPTGQQLAEDSLALKLFYRMFSKSNMSRLRSRQKRVKPPKLPEKQLFLFGWFTTRSDCQLVRSSSIFLSKEGIFTVVGRAAGVSMPIIANVKVTAKHIVDSRNCLRWID